MKIPRSPGAHVLLGLVLVACAGCGRDQTHESDHAANYERIFGASPPARVDVVNSVVIEYSWRLGTVTTDDWEIEIVARREWIELQVEDMQLSLISGDSLAAQSVRERKAKPGRPWYAPQPLESYDTFALTLTSVPYVHMLVETDPRHDGRFRLYMSKH